MTVLPPVEWQMRDDTVNACSMRKLFRHSVGLPSRNGQVLHMVLRAGVFFFFGIGKHLVDVASYLIHQQMTVSLGNLNDALAER